MTHAVHEFTTVVPQWKPHVTPVDLDQATPAQLDALQVTPSNRKISDYVLVLAHDVETLKHRSPLFNAIMYNRGGMSRAEREIGAVGASIVNRCIYCAAVHAGRYNQLTKDETAITKIFADGVEAEHRRAALRDPALCREAVGVSAGRRCRRSCAAQESWLERRGNPRPDPVVVPVRLGQPADAHAGRTGRGMNQPPAIGPRLQAQRKARNLTLAELAAASGVSRSMLSEIERGNANPTYGTLWHLTRALGLDFNGLIDGISGEPRSIERQTGHATPVIRSADGSCSLQILSPASMVSVTEWYLLTFEPKGRLISEPHIGRYRRASPLHGRRDHRQQRWLDDRVACGGNGALRGGRAARLVSTGVGPAKAFLVVAFEQTKPARAKS